MKIRNDFVTNSSSSSFVLITNSSNEILINAIKTNKLEIYIGFFHDVLEQNEISQKDIKKMVASWTNMGTDSHGNYIFSTDMDNYPLGEILSEIGGCIYYMEG